MITTLRILVAATLLWALVALAAQVFRAWGGGRHDFSRRAGSRKRGIVYSFTTAMMPGHKEAIRLHPAEFAIGMVMHLGVAVSVVGIVVLLVRPAAGLALLDLAQPVLGLSLLAGAFLFFRRFRLADLRTMSVPDDYLAIVATCGLMLVAGLAPIAGAATIAILLIYAGLFFLYLPLGKLRHAVFFFLARGEYGRRLGYRGVYPPAGME